MILCKNRHYGFILQDDQISSSLRSALRDILENKSRYGVTQQQQPQNEADKIKTEEEMDGQLSPKSPEMVDEDNEGDPLLYDRKLYDDIPERYSPDYGIDPEKHHTKLSPGINPLEEEENEKEMQLERPRLEMSSLPVRESFKETYGRLIQELLEKPVIERFEVFLQEFREKKLRSKISINLQHEGAKHLAFELSYYFLDFENFCKIVHIVFEPDFAQIPTGNDDWSAFYR